MEIKKTTNEFLENAGFLFDGRSHYIDIGLFNKLVIMNVGTPFIASITSECPKTKDVKEIMLGFICDYENQVENLFFALSGNKLELKGERSTCG